MILKSETFRQAMAALFFVGGIVLFGFLVLTLGRDKGLIRPRFPVTVLYKNVRGLVEGAPVRLAGVNVGSVEDIAFLEKPVAGHKVEVTLSVFEMYRPQLQDTAQFYIKTEGILGEKIVVIDVEESSQLLDVDQPVLGEDSVDVQVLAEVFAQAAESFTHTSDELSKIQFDELSEVMTKAARSLAGTAQGINSVLEELSDLSLKSKRLMNRIEERIIDGTLFKVF